MSETAWLIEHYASDGQALYWCGLRGTSNMWSVSSLHAIRFVRKIDATRVARSLPSPSGLAREHMWVD